MQGGALVVPLLDLLEWAQAAGVASEVRGNAHWPIIFTSSTAAALAHRSLCHHLSLPLLLILNPLAYLLQWDWDGGGALPMGLSTSPSHQNSRRQRPTVPTPYRQCSTLSDD
jgi:hypothetical protein